MATVTVPDYEFGGFYYPEVLQTLLAYIRVYAPELTSESEYDEHIQLLRAFSLVCHLNNVNLDVAANELNIESARLRQSVANLLKLINVFLQSATPAEAELVIRLSTIPNVDIPIYIPEYTNFSTEDPTIEEIIFENTSDLAMTRGDEVGYVYGVTTTTNFASDGSVNTNYPTRFTSASATFTSADIGRWIFVSASSQGNAGDYLITNWIDANNIEVTGSTFTTETSLEWRIYEFSANGASSINQATGTFQPWSVHRDGNMMYVGHATNQWDQIDFDFNTFAGGMQGIYEYYDDTYSTNNPDSVTDNGTYITFDIDVWIGGLFLATGANIKVTYGQTGRSEWCVSYFSGGNNKIDTKTILGQTAVSTTVTDYIISAEWVPVQNISDDTILLPSPYEWTQDGAVTYDYPVTATRRWVKSTVNEVEAYWIRYRIFEGISLSALPIITEMDIDQGDQYFPFEVVQGETVDQEILGSGNGQAGQEFTTELLPVFDDSFLLEVDESGSNTWIEWAGVTSFVNSGSSDRHYKYSHDVDDRLLIKCGDGTFGKKFPIGTDNIRITYRIGGEDNGNVGSNQITGNVGSISYVAALANPMPASGWTVKDGGTEEDLEIIKDTAPARIRNQEKAVNISDIARVAVDEYRTADGSAPIARAFAIEEAYGPKTVQLVVVGTGGNFLTTEELEDVEEYFNGDRYAIPPVYGALLLNNEVTAVNYDPYEIDVTVTVIGKGLTVNQVTNAITDYLNPLAVKSDGVTWAHDFGGNFAVVMLDCAIEDISDDIKNIIRTVPSADISLGPTQLPYPGTTINVTIQETE